MSILFLCIASYNLAIEFDELFSIYNFLPIGLAERTVEERVHNGRFILVL